jgi:hypothetical protein
MRASSRTAAACAAEEMKSPKMRSPLALLEYRLEEGGRTIAALLPPSILPSSSAPYPPSGKVPFDRNVIVVEVVVRHLGTSCSKL